MTTNGQIACLLFWLVGCSSSALDPNHPSPVLDRGPHQGALRPIAGADGFIEVAIEPIRDAPSGSPKFRVAIYFLNRDQTGPLKPLPTEVSMTATWRDAPAPAAVDLVIGPVPGDPTGAAKFVAPPSDHQGEPSGTVRARLGDRPIPETLVSQHLPRLWNRVRDGQVRPLARDLLVAAVRAALDPYGAACAAA